MLWSYQTNFYISSSPAISHGRVYIGSWDWNMYCFSMDTGILLWNYSTDGQITSSPAVANGKVYFGSQDSKFYCLNAIDGSFLWDFDSNFMIESSPAIVEHKVFFGSSDGSLYCLNADDGSLLWNYQTGSVVLSSPAVANGNVYFGVTNGEFLCIDGLDGNLLWTYPMTDGVYSSPVVLDGKVYFGSNDKNVYCLDAITGNLIWNYSALSEVHSSPAIAGNSLFVGTSDGRLLCLNRDNGGFVWSYQISGSVESSPSVADGKVFFATDPCCGFSSYFLCLNASTGSKIWEYNFITQYHTKSSAALAAGKVFVGSGDGKVFAFGDIEFLADANGPYNGVVNTLIDFSGSVYGGEPGFSWFWDFGDGTTSVDQNPTHAYEIVGDYAVTLTITDSLGQIVTDETQAFIELPNNPPDSPSITGPTSGITGVPYDYLFTSNDPDGDEVSYFVDWGDNTTSGWIGPGQSGVVLKLNHIWSVKGTFIIKAKTKDIHGAQSSWSNPFGMTIFSPELSVEIKGGVGISVILKNTGEASVTNVAWNITIDGGIIIPSEKTGTIPIIHPDGQSKIYILVFGFGKKTITISLVSSEGFFIKKTASASFFLFFVFGIK